MMRNGPQKSRNINNFCLSFNVLYNTSWAKTTKQSFLKIIFAHILAGVYCSFYNVMYSGGHSKVNNFQLPIDCSNKYFSIKKVEQTFAFRRAIWDRVSIDASDPMNNLK